MDATLFIIGYFAATIVGTFLGIGVAILIARYAE
jgi:hypothetical protein